MASRSSSKKGVCNGKACKICGLVSMQLLLLLWSLAGNFFSAWTLADCRFLYADPTYFPPTYDDEGSGDVVKTSRYTGYVGLYRIEKEKTEEVSYPQGGGYSRTWTQCYDITGDVVDEFDTLYRVARLMGVVGLTTGGLATIVLILTFFIEMCCATPGVQYGLGVMYTIAALTQGLTFLGVDSKKCNELGCVISTTATWSILAVCLYFIALVHAFVVPFPREKICSKACFCPCCEKKEDEDVEGKGVQDEEAQEEYDDDAAKAAAAGAAAGAGAAAVVAAADDEDEADEFADEEAAMGSVAVDPDDPNAAAAVAVGAGAAGAAVAVAAAAGDDEEDDGAVEDEADVKASASSDAAAGAENCGMMASSIYTSVAASVAACAPGGGGEPVETVEEEGIPSIEPSDADKSD